MKRILCLASGLLLLASVASATTITYANRAAFNAAAGGSPTTIDFEGIAPADGYVQFPGATTVIGGVDFTQFLATSPYLIVVSATFPAGPSDLYNYGTGDSMQSGSRGYSGAASYLQATFSSSVNFLGVDLFSVSDNASTYQTFVVLDLANGDSQTIQTSAGMTTTFLGLHTTPAINSVRFYSNDPNAYVNIDNLSYAADLNTAAVPEPGTLMLMGLGFAGLVATRLRARRA